MLSGMYSVIDQFLTHFDKGLRTLFAPAHTVRPVPGASLPDAQLSDAERKHAAALMRVNHVGEICAQALYQGQAIASTNDRIKAALGKASQEETEHLAWTERRIAELGGRKSLFNPLWYAGALTIGIVAGRSGDSWNLGFLAETENQVGAHLGKHLARLPPGDLKSWAILDQMKTDEAKHAQTALALGGRELPRLAKAAMRFASKLMTSTAYRV